MTRKVRVAASAAGNLRRMVEALHLPADAIARVQASLAPLAEHPGIGVPLPDTYMGGGLCFLLGPWRWMLVVYRVEDGSGDVVVVAIEDARMASSATSRRSPG